MAVHTLLLFSARQTAMMACAMGMRASGMPTNSSAVTAACACSMARGSAKPTSSLACTTMRRTMSLGSTPA